MKKRKKRSVAAGLFARVADAIRDIGDGAVNATAQYQTVAREMAGEVDNEKQRRSPLAYVHHMRALAKLEPRRLKKHAGRVEWLRYLTAMEANDPDAYAAYMLEVDKHIDAGELVVILPPELAEEAHQRAAVSGRELERETNEAPYKGVLPQEIAAARVNPDVDVYPDPYAEEMYALERAGETP